MTELLAENTLKKLKDISEIDLDYKERYKTIPGNFLALLKNDMKNLKQLKINIHSRHIVDIFL